MKKITLLPFLLMFFVFALAQENYFEIESIERYDQFFFPVFNSNNTEVDDKINIYIQLKELELLNGFQEEHIFERVALDFENGINSGLDGISFKVLNNTENILSFVLYCTFCGANCNHWSTYYNFNSQTGEKLVLKDLFDINKNELYLTYIKNQIEKNIKYEVEIDTFVEEAEKERFLADIIPKIQESKTFDFYVKGDSLHFDIGNKILKHYEYYYIGINTKTSIHIREFENWLSDYGKNILIDNNKSTFYLLANEQQLYRGTIGKYPITFLWNYYYDDFYNAIYIYNKHGKGIHLNGKKKENVYALEEKNEDWETTGFFELEFINNEYIGKWYNADKTKSYDVKLSKL